MLGCADCSNPLLIVPKTTGLTDVGWSFWLSSCAACTARFTLTNIARHVLISSLLQTEYRLLSDYIRLFEMNRENNVYFMPEHGNGISQAENEKNPKKYLRIWIDMIPHYSIIAFSKKQVLIGNYREDSSFHCFRK